MNKTRRAGEGPDLIVRRRFLLKYHAILLHFLSPNINPQYPDPPSLLYSAAMERDEEEKMSKIVEVEGIASLALLPSGCISGHFIQLPQSVCYGLHGTELKCERECSHGEDYRLIKLTITEYKSQREKEVVVECRGHDAAKISSTDHAHGWHEEVVSMLEEKRRKSKVSVSFQCETLKAEQAADEHLRKFMPKLVGMDAVVNIGPMRITGLDFDAENET